MNVTSPADLAVIIPAFNEERFIGHCLDALLPQVTAARAAGHRCEVVVVDNGSTDGTREACASRGISVLSAPSLKVGGVRNLGVRHTHSRLLAFLDADCVPRAGWVERALQSQDDGPCLTGSTYALPDKPHWIEAAWFATEPSGRRDATHINAGNLIVPRHAFEAIGGFDESLASGEDFELAQRIRRHLPVISDDRIELVHLGNPKTLRRFLQREIWHGLGALASARHDWRDKPLLGTLAFIAGIVGVVAGLLLGLTTADWRLLGVSAALLALLIVATVEYRTRLRHGLVLRARLALLYGTFYLGRSIALARLAAGGARYVRPK